MRFLLMMAMMLAVPALASERIFSFADVPLDHSPPGFLSTVGGSGGPGLWKVILDEAPTQFESLTGRSTTTSKRAVLAQEKGEPVDEHFPMLIFNEETFGDFRFSTRFKIVGGGVGQMAGVVFRYQDERNYYVLLASALDKHFWFFKVVNGQRGTLIGPPVSFSTNEWRELAVECKGNRIRCFLDGQEAIPELTDNSFGTGRIGFWTKSDSTAYFADARITYTPRNPLAQKLVQDAIQQYPRLLDLAVFARRAPETGLAVIAAREQSDIGRAGGELEAEVLSSGKPHFQKTRSSVIVTMPLRDRNGEPIAAVQVTMRTFVGETHDNAMMRARPIVRRMQNGVQSVEDLLQ